MINSAPVLAQDRERLCVVREGMEGETQRPAAWRAFVLSDREYAGLERGLDLRETARRRTRRQWFVGVAALGVVSAIFYATGIALNAESLSRTRVWLFQAQEDRYRLLARNMTDVITRHHRNGAVRFVSPAAEQLFGVKASELHGHQLFERVHVADRPAYLTALADAVALLDPRSVEFRVQRDGPLDPEQGGRAKRDFIWVEMRCRRLDVTARNGEEEVVAVMRDVTERKSQMEALEHEIGRAHV